MRDNEVTPRYILEASLYECSPNDLNEYKEISCSPVDQGQPNIDKVILYPLSVLNYRCLLIDREEPRSNDWRLYLHFCKQIL